LNKLQKLWPYKRYDQALTSLSQGLSGDWIKIFDLLLYFDSTNNSFAIISQIAIL